MHRVAIHLENLGHDDIDPIRKSEGICAEIRDTFGVDAMMKVLSLISKWELHSGDKLFPVPSPYGMCPQKIYCDSNNLWIGKYGALRRELCLFLARELMDD